MKKLDLGQTISTLANIGVLAGIIFLAIEVRQNQASLEEANAINRASSSTAAFEYFNETRTMLAQDEDLTRIWLSGLSGDDLSPVDRSRFENVCGTLLWTYVAVYRRYKSLGQEREALGMTLDLANQIQAPGMRECWENSQQVIIRNGNEDFLRLVEQQDKTLSADQ